MLARIRPRHYFHRITDISLKALKENGIRALIVDVDNTLTPWQSEHLSDEVCRWVTDAKDSGFRVVLLSNNSRQRVATVADRLGIPYVAKAKKPFPGNFVRAMRTLGASPGETSVIGDQLFTDMLGGNSLGLLTILVQPITAREYAATRLVRRVERVFLGYYGRRGLSPGAPGLDAAN